ncbi:excinuclease ABC subunit B, partial [Lactobacillus sp. XV13L]|nr:excinuclease ABC subunit B [Lactobacillus sp. XV13L]
MYADTITDSMRQAIEATRRRRKLQIKFNEEHGMTPQTIVKPIRDVISATKVAEVADSDSFADLNFDELTAKQKKDMIKDLRKQMQDAAKKLDFEGAATLRDAIMELESSTRKPIKKKGKTLNGK